MDRSRLVCHAATLTLLAIVAGCSPRCSLFTTVDPDDAGEFSFVRQVVPKLYGRKIRGQVETRVLADVIAATPNGEGRQELLGALMASPEFAGHWQENLVDFLRVNRIGDKSLGTCYDTPLRASVDGALARDLLAARADLAGFAATPPAAFNMSDVLASALRADTVFPVYSAHLFAMQSRPLQGNEVTEENKRTDMSAIFQAAYLHRKLECLQCHHSSFSTTGPQTYWNRTYPIWGKFEKAVFENEQGGDHERLDALLRTDVLGSPARTPWGSAAGQGLQQCGSFRASAPATDPLGVVPYLTQSLPVGASIWDVNRLLDQGRRTLATNGLVRSKPVACGICNQPQCTTGTNPPPQQPQTNDVHALFAAKGCHGCHGNTAPAAGLNLADNSPVGDWTGNVVEQPSQTDPTIVRARRGDPNSSMLVQKLRGTAPGGRMPPGGPFLNSAEMATVENWINTIPAPTIPVACNVCQTDTCTALGSDLDGPAALAFLLGMNVSEQLWQELVGTRLTIANYFPRTADQKNVLWNLTEYSLVPNDWSLREPIKRVLLSSYFNRKTPLAATPAVPYDEPLVRDPWIEADPRVPPLALATSPPPGSAPPAPDPAYKAADHPENHRNSISEGIHRYSARSLAFSMHAALGWPAPQRFAGAAYPNQELLKAIGQFVRDSEPGFRETDFQGLLKWEETHRSCAKPAGVMTDWIDRLLDAVAAHNAANPSAPLKMRDVVLVMKDWFLSDARIGNTTLTHDDNRNENDLIDAFFGGDVDALDAQAATPAQRSALEGVVREYCGVLVQTPQFWLAGIAPSGIGDPLKLRVCNGPPCSYEEICNAVAGGFVAANSRYRVLCSANSLQVVPKPVIKIDDVLVDLCVGGRCRFVPLPWEFVQCLRRDDGPSRCLPQMPPRCDLGCARIDCCGGPLPPLDVDGKPRPSMLLGWFEGRKVATATGVRRLPADARARGETRFVPLESGVRLVPGDLLELAPEAQLRVRTERGTFETPKGGMPAHPAGGPWYLMVTGPSVVRGELHPPPPVRMTMSRQEAERIDAYNRRQQLRGFAQPPKGVHDLNERLKARIDGPAAQPAQQPRR